jgi:hypothetical protein
MVCNTCSTPDGQIQTYNFNCKAGDTFERGLTITDQSTGNPIDITGWTFFMSIYASWSAKQADDPPLITLANGTGFTITSPTLGMLNLLITDTQTGTITFTAPAPYGSNIPTNTCIYDFLGVDADNNQQTEMQGNFVFSQRLTVGP